MARWYRCIDGHVRCTVSVHFTVRQDFVCWVRDRLKTSEASILSWVRKNIYNGALLGEDVLIYVHEGELWSTKEARHYLLLEVKEIDIWDQGVLG